MDDSFYICADIVNFVYSYKITYMDPTINPISVEPRVKKPNKLGIAIFVLIVLILVVSLLIFRQSKKEQTQVSISPTSVPTPTEKLTIDKQKVKIQVLNGTGTPGQAGKAADALKNAGFNADNIKTDNAPEDQSVTTISAKTGYEDMVNDIKAALSDLFDKINVDSSTLTSDSEFDVIVTTGGKKFEVPTSTPIPSSASATPTVTTTPSPTKSPTPTLTTTPTP